MIGSRDDALRALDGDLPLLSAIGTDRLVYRVDNLVYKVNRNTSDYDANEVEHNALRILRDMRLPSGIVIPPVGLHTVNNEFVLAMPYISGIETGECSVRWNGLIDCEDNGLCLSDAIADALNNIGVNDLAWGNVIRNGNRHYLIDAGDSYLS